MPGRYLFYRIAAIHLTCLALAGLLFVYGPFYIPTTAVSDVSIAPELAEGGMEVVGAEDTAQTATIMPLYFVGDVMLGRHVEYLMTKNGAAYPYKNLNFLKDAPAHVIGNFEASVPEVHKKTPNFGFTFSVSALYLPALVDAGFTHLSLANNHATDYGLPGLASSQNNLATLGVVPFGEPRGFSTSTAITYLQSGDTVVALIGLHTLFTVPTEAEIKQVLETAARQSTVQIVYVHWGTEYELVPSNRERALARVLVDAGADLIVGHHPHVVQSIELIDAVPVFYSLGNFIFDQYFSKAVQEGLVLKLDFITPQPQITLMPVTTRYSNAQPRLQQGQEKQAFLTLLANRSDVTLQAAIQSGVLSFPIRLATSTETAIMN